MKKLVLLFLLLLTSSAYATPPVRQVDYVPNTTIRSADVTANEDEVLGYLQTGVDNIRQNGIDNANELSSSLCSANQVLKKNSAGTAWECGNASSTDPGWTDDGTVVRLTTSTDKVGIGITNPTGRMQIIGTGQSSAASALLIQDSLLTNNILAVKNSGSVGIGLTNPSTLLEVVGTATVRALIINSGSSSSLTSAGTGTFITVKTNASLGAGKAVMNFIEGTGNPTGGSLISFNNGDAEFADISGDGNIVFDPTGATTGTPKNNYVDMRSAATNLYLGRTSGAGLTTGAATTCVGQVSCAALTGSTTRNTVFGSGSLNVNTSGSFNTIVGDGTAPLCNGCSKVVSLGSSNFDNLTTGVEQIAIGVDSAQNLTTESFGIYIGRHVAFDAVGLVNDIIIGSTAYDNTTNNDNNTKLVMIGDNSQATTANITNGGCIGYGCSVDASNSFSLSGSTAYKVGIGTTTPLVLLTLGNTTSTTTAAGGLKINGQTGGCIIFQDTDHLGFTECCALNGVLTCGIDADALPDGTP